MGPPVCLPRRDVVEAASRFPLRGLRVAVCRLLGHHAPDRLGQLRPGAVRDLLHAELVAGAILRVGPKLRHVHSLLLSRPSDRHHGLLLREDHL